MTIVSSWTPFRCLRCPLPSVLLRCRSWTRRNSSRRWRCGRVPFTSYCKSKIWWRWSVLTVRCTDWGIGDLSRRWGLSFHLVYSRFTPVYFQFQTMQQSRRPSTEREQVNLLIFIQFLFPLQAVDLMCLKFVIVLKLSLFIFQPSAKKSRMDPEDEPISGLLIIGLIEFTIDPWKLNSELVNLILVSPLRYLYAYSRNTGPGRSGETFAAGTEASPAGTQLDGRHEGEWHFLVFLHFVVFQHYHQIG